MDTPVLPLRRQRGDMMVEAVLAMLVFTLVGVAVLIGVSTAQTSASKFQGQALAENLGRNQMESVFGQTYQPPPGSYSTLVPPQGYTVDAQALEHTVGDPDIERVVVTVNRGSQTLLVMETLRSND